TFAVPAGATDGPITIGGGVRGLAAHTDWLSLKAVNTQTLTPTLSWGYFTGIKVDELDLYVSVFPAGQELLPKDEWFTAKDRKILKKAGFKTLQQQNEVLGTQIGSTGKYDFNPNRILTKTWTGSTAGTTTSFTLDDLHRLTANQTYYWAVRAKSL